MTGFEIFALGGILFSAFTLIICAILIWYVKHDLK